MPSSYLAGHVLPELAPSVTGLPRLHRASPSASLDKNVMWLMKIIIRQKQRKVQGKVQP